jgi:hypothetical protein
MPARTLETQIDRLYQLPLDEFTAARNALAKGAGSDGAQIRALQKPSVAAWAVNQLYWQKRDVWDALIAAAESARRAHKAVLSGRSGDVRASSEVHEESVEAALKHTLGLLQSSGHPVTDATKQQIATTLRALPSDEEAGRLTHALQPGGFEMLAGVAVSAGATRHAPAPKPDRRPKEEAATRSKQDAKTLTRAREAASSASRALREAEQAVRREEFEIARATREEKRAGEAVEKAREALARTQAELKDAERELAASKEAREAAERRAREAGRALTDARARHEAAAAALQKLEEA